MLIGYNRSPAVICLEHDEQRDLIRHPEKASHYAALIEQRQQKHRKNKKIKIEIDE